MSDRPADLDYPKLLRQALLDMVRGLLTRAAAEGLPGDHHFYLTFGTAAPGVGLSPRLRHQHPEEMTIVLQHQFWDLSVDGDAFSVTLRFGASPERLTVPFLALRAFADPSCGFALRLAPETAAPAPAAPAEPASSSRGEVSSDLQGDAAPAAAKVVDFEAYRRRDDGDSGA